ncbi:MAG: ABC transporter ATP-binding protein [Gammaproteobacteria bacterium]|nr:ABC transporter ATP-binding protein [Gammaproteobacteria bacterium]
MNSAAIPLTATVKTDALVVENLDLAYRVRGRERQVLRDVSFRIGRGESFGLVGESGCGKSTVAFAAVRYLPRNGRVRGGRILIDGRDILSFGDTELRKLRTSSVAMVYQDSARALNPSIRIGRQVAEVFEIAGASRAQALERTTAILAKVRIVDPARVMERYPHQLSGGMQQRVAIAMAIANKPKLLILDEPTTGLDATVEAEILELIAELRLEFGTSTLFISHNLALITQMCDRVGVLYAGKLVEEGTTRDVFHNPRHPYTAGLLRCLPQGGRRKNRGRLDVIPGFLPTLGAVIHGCVFADRCPLATEQCRSIEPPLYALANDHTSRCHYHEMASSTPPAIAEQTLRHTVIDRRQSPILVAQQINKTFTLGEHKVRALHDVSLSLWPGETLGLVGESGSGKTTLARVLLGLTSPDDGSVLTLDGASLPARAVKRAQAQLKAIQIVFQNPDSALNRSHTVSRLIGRALKKLAGLSGQARRERLLELTRAVRLTELHLSTRPKQLSGGLKQRVAIARAFAGDPRLVVCDEPTSALDVSVQAAILNLLADLQAERRVSYVFISHDLGVVRYLADRIAVLYLGRLMELGPAERVMDGPHHPYTEALLSAVPSIRDGVQQRIRLQGEIPSAINPPSGCVFHTRCPRKLGAVCEQQEPPMTRDDEDHEIRCHIPVAELARLQKKSRAAKHG